VRERWQEETGDLRGFKVELARGSRGSGRAWGGGSVMEQGSPEKKRGWQWCGLPELKFEWDIYSQQRGSERRPARG
jgi:hypothetical protein